MITVHLELGSEIVNLSPFIETGTISWGENGDDGLSISVKTSSTPKRLFSDALGRRLIGFQDGEEVWSGFVDSVSERDDFIDIVGRGDIHRFDQVENFNQVFTTTEYSGWTRGNEENATQYNGTVVTSGGDYPAAIEGGIYNYSVLTASGAELLYFDGLKSDFNNRVYIANKNNQVVKKGDLEVFAYIFPQDSEIGFVEAYGQRRGSQLLPYYAPRIQMYTKEGVMHSYYNTHTLPAGKSFWRDYFVVDKNFIETRTPGSSFTPDEINYYQMAFNLIGLNNDIIAISDDIYTHELYNFRAHSLEADRTPLELLLPSPSGTDAEFYVNRNSKIVPGAIVLITDNALGPEIVATGGTVTDITISGVDYRVHTFTSNGTFTVTKNVNVEYLIVAGGGGGGSRRVAQGGGGGGGVLTNLGSPTSITPAAYPIVVGSGGAGGGSGGASQGSDGGSSSFNSISATGGGGGGAGAASTSTINNGRTGGSGGGGGNKSDTTAQGANGITGQGNRGGNAAGIALTSGAGGGGGAGSVGSNGSGNNGGNGGNGIANAITGTSVVYGGGGGGSRGQTSGTNGSGGSGGGGNAGAGPTTLGDGRPGTDGLGGGGGGANGENTTPVNATGGNGGSGVVIIRYVLNTVSRDNNQVIVIKEVEDVTISGIDYTKFTAKSVYDYVTDFSPTYLNIDLITVPTSTVVNNILDRYYPEIPRVVIDTDDDQPNLAFKDTSLRDVLNKLAETVKYRYYITRNTFYFHKEPFETYYLDQDKTTLSQSFDNVYTDVKVRFKSIYGLDAVGSSYKPTTKYIITKSKTVNSGANSKEVANTYAKTIGDEDKENVVKVVPTEGVLYNQYGGLVKSPKVNARIILKQVVPEIVGLTNKTYYLSEIKYDFTTGAFSYVIDAEEDTFESLLRRTKA